MASYVRLQAETTEDGVGNVLTDIVVSNHEDAVLARNGHLSPAAVRQVRTTAVLVDTGATTLSLPESLIVELGLPLKRVVVAETAQGSMHARLHDEAEVQIFGRSAVVECLALPDGSRPLLGVIPLEMLGLQPNVVSRSLLPDNGPGTYLYA